MHPGGLCKRFFHCTRSLFLPLPHQHPPTKAQRENSKIPFLGEDPSVEGSKHRVTTCAWKKLFFCQVGCHLETGYIECTQKSIQCTGKWNRKKEILPNGQVSFTDVLKCSWFTKMSMWINLGKKPQQVNKIHSQSGCLYWIFFSKCRILYAEIKPSPHYFSLLLLARDLCKEIDQRVSAKKVLI